MVPFGKQQEVLRDLSTSSPEDLSETVGRLFIEGGVVVITNEKSAGVQVSREFAGRTDVPHQETIAGQTERPCHSSPSLGREILGLGLLELGVVP